MSSLEFRILTSLFSDTLTTNRIVVFRRRKLPHWDIEGHPIFITACLYGGIPAAGYQRIEKYRKKLDSRPRPKKYSDHQWEHHKHKLVFAFIDDLLDGDCPVTYLNDDAQAEIVSTAFQHFADDRYRLFAFVVMPSHHHWIF